MSEKVATAETARVMARAYGLDASTCERALAIRDVMAPVDEGHFVTAGTPVADAREAALRNGHGAVAVVDGAGRLVGIYFARE